MTKGMRRLRALIRIARLLRRARAPAPPPPSGAANPAAFFAELARAVPVTYTEADRYRDFRRTFMAHPAGKRVLNTLFEWGLLHSNSYREGASTHDMLVREGRRYMALRILDALDAAPSEDADETLE